MADVAAEWGRLSGGLAPSYGPAGLRFEATAVALNVAGIAGADPGERDLSWGIVSTSGRIGTEVGLALLVAVAGARSDALAGGAMPADGRSLAGYRAAFGVSGALALVGVVGAARWMPADGERGNR